ncbi:MAG TPA: rhomboid family intramembrane serine protease [Terriglobales bacterium]
MLIPIKHENMSARRWPVVTFGLIAINLLIFLGTHWNLEDEQKQLGQLKLHVILLAASHPELNVPASSQDVVSAVKDHYPKQWTELQNPHRPAFDAWDAQKLQTQDGDALQSEMDSLSTQLSQARDNSILDKYAFVPAHPTAFSYLTANFLHGGWLHLIGNMWFLWLAGFVLEDFWGRPLYTAFYLVAGAASMQFDAWLSPGSIVPTLGASGAIAALMGAFLVRFPKMRIEMLWWFFLRPRRFKAPAYWLLPAWLFVEVFYGSVFGQSSGVAHWAHVGGFLFGALAALGLRYSGLEHKAHQQVEQELTLESDPDIQRASDLIDQGQLDSAEILLQEHITQKPDSVDGYNLLLQCYRKQNAPIPAEILEKLCAIHLKAGESELAWISYEDYLNGSGPPLPAAMWLEVCRAAEKLQHFDRALSEYEKLIQAYPAERQSILAQLAAGRICLKRLNQPQRALVYFEAAQNSPVPHLDWEQGITSGIREAKLAMAQKGKAASASS